MGIKDMFIKPAKTEWLSFLICMPVLAFLLNSLLFQDRLWSDRDVWFLSYPIVYIQGFASWYLHIAVMHWLRIIFPDIKQTIRRLLILFVLHVVLTSLTFAMLFYGYDAVDFLNYQLDLSQFEIALLVALALTIVTTTIWESDYTIRKWKDSLAKKELMQHVALLNEFETLKGQVNPHFLFNCFNTLLSLITEDTKKAESFLDELSKVYRYLLQNNEESLSSLQNEIKFIRSYLQLLSTRYGEALQFEIEVDKRYEHYMLPSVSLQLLVENAVKHNIITKQSPLSIDIFTTEGNKLIVTNNLQKRTVKTSSSKIGLKNIRLKYELLKQPGFQVLEDDKNFTVVLPLMWNQINTIKVNLLTKQKENISR